MASARGFLDGASRDREGVRRCLSDDSLAAFLEDRLDGSELAGARGHVADCDDCRSVLAHAARSLALSRVAGKSDTLPAACPRADELDGAQLVRPGALLADKYQVERLLGAGGMGYVVAATNVALDQRVAIKFLLPEVAAAPGATARFLHEARAAAKIESEHVVRVLDVTTLASGASIIVMEYLDGRDLRALLDEDGPCANDVAAGFILEACEGLAHAHAAGIVHRDLKPANLFVARRRDGAVLKILDFGVSKIRENGGRISGHPTTAPRTALGTPLYMSPEQVRSSADVDVRADIWALGVILFELVIGQPPFSAETVTALSAKILEEPAPRLRALLPTAGEELEAIVERCLAKDPHDRFPDVAALALALAPLSSPDMRALAVRAQRVLGSSAAPLATAHRALRGRGKKRRSATRRGAVLLLAAGALALGIAAIYARLDARGASLGALPRGARSAEVVAPPRDDMTQPVTLTTATELPAPSPAAFHAGQVPVPRTTALPVATSLARRGIPTPAPHASVAPSARFIVPEYGERK